MGGGGSECIGCTLQVRQSQYNLQFIQIYHRMRNRTKYDWTKPFKFVDSKKAFDELETNEESLIISIPVEDARAVEVQKKEEIPVPKIDTVKRATEIKKFAKITPNYIRLPPHLNLPSANTYELTEVDHIFLKSHQDRFIYKGKRLLTSDFLGRAFVELELKAGKDMTLPRNKGWIMSFLEKQNKDLLQWEGVELFADTVYNYWKNRREELKFPLLRLLWKPNPDEYGHMLAFRPREREKRSLRRTNRVVQDEIIEELFEEFDLSLKAADRVQMREELKFKQVQLQMTAFYTECRGFCSQPDYLEEFRIQQRSKDKERMKNLHSDLELYKNRKQSFENVSLESNGVSEVDQKLSIINFLSTVAYEAENIGINYDRIFSASGFLSQQKSKVVVPVAPLSIEEPSVDSKVVPVENKNPEQYLSISLKRQQDLLIRSFEQDEEETYHVKPCKDYLEYKRRKIDRYYFGSDDEGETKDIRKNISVSFKKFQQLQQLTRTYSVISENN